MGSVSLLDKPANRLCDNEMRAYNIGQWPEKKFAFTTCAS